MYQRSTLSALTSLALLFAGCTGQLASGSDAGMATPDAASILPSDGGLAPADAARPDAAAPLDAGSSPLIDAGPAATGETPLAGDVQVDEVAIFQGVKITLAEAGGAVAAGTRNAPVVGGRDGLFRIYARGATRSLTAEVRVTRAGETRVFSDTRTLRQPSVDEDPGSTFEVEVPGDWLTSTSRWSVAIVEPGGVMTPDGTPSDARFPRLGGDEPLEAIDDPGGFRLMIVPFSWESDGSGRLPDTSPAQVELLRDYFGAIFPYASIEIEVHDVLAWTGGLTWTGNVDFGDVNSRLVSLRAEEGAPADVYYYGLVAPATSRSAYCGRSCVTGQAFVVGDPDDARIRVGSGLGFSGERTAGTLQHELGHIHGRGHAPCGATRGIDPSYPYSDGRTGVWGYDRIERTYHPPDAPDLMGYCDDRWISDYNYEGIFERHLAIHRLTRASAVDLQGPELLSFVRVDGDGRTTRLRDVMMALPRSGRTWIEWISSAGRSIAWDEAARLELSHAEDKLLLLPQAPEGAIAFRLAGGELTRVPDALR